MKSIFKKILLIILIFTTILTMTLVFGFNYFWNQYKLTDLTKLIPNGNITIYDKDGKMLANLSETYNAYATYDEIPEVMIKAIMAIEDSRFFTHDGLDYQSIIRAIIANLQQKGYSQGASTITQQLVKNIYLSNEKTLERKIKEAILALKLEKVLSKEDIIASYLANILFGGRIYGVKMASYYYFNKALDELTLSDAATLAGLVQMPNTYDPFKNLEKATTRRNLVLKRMLELHYIDENTYQKTLQIKLNDTLEKGLINNNIGPYASYFDYVLKTITNTYPESVNTQTEITIPMDQEIQTFVYEIMQNIYQTFPNEEMEAGIIVIENKTNEIKAIGGSRATGFLNLNYATDVLNQPGSTIKPILSYAPAIEYLNYYPLTQINDEVYYYPDGTLVNNWDHLYKGYLSLREALSDSRNIPAIKLYKLIGDEKAWEFANSLGITNKDGFYHESMAIGGFKYGYTVLEMTNAYTAFPNGGIYQKAKAINKIKLNNQEITINYPTKRVMREDTAFLINDILHDVLADSVYDLKNNYLSAKTGQSNYDTATIEKYGFPYNATKDSWVIGYTKEYTVGVWCGYGSLGEGKYLNRTTKNIPLTIMKMILERFSTKYEQYQVPHTLSYLTVDIKNGQIYEYTNQNTAVYQDYFYNGFIPKKKHTDLEEI